MKRRLKKSHKIYNKAVKKFEPEAIIMMVSGGNDSLVASEVAKELDLAVDYLMFINTGTGIPETVEWVRNYGKKQPWEFLEAKAGNAWEDYVKRKGFIGRGWFAHSIAYHICKAGPMRKKLSEVIRKGRQGINILLLNGARKDESENRKINLPDIYNRDPSQKGNIWTNIIHHWTDGDCDRYIESRNLQVNPVTKTMCRSGECNCGTMQPKEDRHEIEALYPEFGKWLNGVRYEVMEEEPKFPWDWGCEQPDWYKQLAKGQMGLMGEHEEYDHQFQPMCVGCKKEVKV